MEHIVSDKKPLVYWIKYDEPKKIINVFGKEDEIKGEWKCDNPLVIYGWFIGAVSPLMPNEAVLLLQLLMKDGSRKEFKVKDTNDFEEAEKWLQEIENK